MQNVVQSAKAKKYVLDRESLLLKLKSYIVGACFYRSIWAADRGIDSVIHMLLFPFLPFGRQ